MGRERDASMVGSGRTRALPGQGTHTIGFEWMSFSGRIRLSGADELLAPTASFWEALLADDREHVRAGLQAAAQAGVPLELTCRLVTRSGARAYLLKGEVVAGAPALAPRVMGVLIELDPGATQAPIAACAGEGDEIEVFTALLEGLAGILGDEPVAGGDDGPWSFPEEPEGAEA
jgi:hypothetical protein